MRLAACLLAILLAGCGGEAPPSGPEENETDLERLRSLPYAAFSEGTAGEDSGVSVHDPGRTSPGLTLYAIQPYCTAELIDEGGATVHAWSHEPCGRWERAELLPGGDLLAIGADPPARADGAIPDATRYLLRLTFRGEVVWKRRMHAHHDVELTPDGSLLVLGFRRRQIPSLHPRLDTRDDLAVLLDQDGREIGSRSLLEAFRASAEIHPLQAVQPNRLGGRPWLDLLHSNSAEWMRRSDLERRHPLYDRGNVLLCFRHQNCVAVLDWEAGRIVWAWGADRLLGPHDAQTLENGNLLVFDNGVGRGWSRVVEVDPLGGEIVWEYRAERPEEFYTLTKGSAQRLPNGNTLIAESDRGRLFEVTREGEIVWEFRTPHRDERGRRAAVVRAVRHERGSALIP